MILILGRGRVFIRQRFELRKVKISNEFVRSPIYLILLSEKRYKNQPNLFVGSIDIAF